MTDVVRIEGLAVDCVVGVNPRERHEPQPLVVDLAMSVDTRPGAVTERLSQTVNYAAVAAQVAFVLENARFRLLETAAHVLAKLLLAPPARGERRAAIERATLRLTKPNALARRAIPSVEITRDASFASLGHEVKPFGTVDVVHETRDAGVYRLNVAPGASIPLHVHHVMQEAELVLSDGLLCQHQPVPAFSSRRWPKGAAHLYENPTDRWQTILCIDAPPFVDADEVPTVGAPAAVPCLPPFLADEEAPPLGGEHARASARGHT